MKEPISAKEKSVKLVVVLAGWAWCVVYVLFFALAMILSPLWWIGVSIMLLPGFSAILAVFILLPKEDALPREPFLEKGITALLDWLDLEGPEKHDTKDEAHKEGK